MTASEEVVDLQGMVVVDRVDLLESGAVLGLEAGELIFLAGDRPQVVERRLGDGRHAGDEGGATVGLDADRRAGDP